MPEMIVSTTARQIRANRARSRESLTYQTRINAVLRRYMKDAGGKR